MNKDHLRYLALGGVFGPLLFTLTFIICAWLRSEYSHMHQLISELGATGTPNADFMNFVGFIPSGIMISVFGVSQVWLLPNHIIFRISTALFILFGMGVVAAGVFSCDEGCPPQGSFENMIHYQVSGPAFLCAYTGILLLGIGFRRLPLWRWLWKYSVISALLSIVFNIGLVNSLESFTYSGVWQRLMLLTIFLWTGMVGISMYRWAKVRTAHKTPGITQEKNNPLKYN